MSSAPNHGSVNVRETGLASKTASAVSLAGHVQQLFSHVKIENLLAGLSGGVVSTLVLHPLDLVKIRFAGTEWNNKLLLTSYVVCNITDNWSSQWEWKNTNAELGYFKMNEFHGSDSVLLWLIFIPYRSCCVTFVRINIEFWCPFNVVSDGLELRPKYSGILHCMKSVWQQEGLRGLYQGVTPNVWGAGASWGLYFFL